MSDYRAAKPSLQRVEFHISIIALFPHNCLDILSRHVHLYERIDVLLVFSAGTIS